MTVTATACPGFIARLLIPGPRKALKTAAMTMGANVHQFLSFGLVAQTSEATLGDKARQRAYHAGEQFAEALNQGA